MAETETATCPHCGAEAPPGGRFCGNCGGALQPDSVRPPAAPHTVLGLTADSVHAAAAAIRAKRDSSRPKPDDAEAGAENLPPTAADSTAPEPADSAEAGEPADDTETEDDSLTTSAGIGPAAMLGKNPEPSLASAQAKVAASESAPTSAGGLAAPGARSFAKTMLMGGGAKPGSGDKPASLSGSASPSFERTALGFGVLQPSAAETGGASAPQRPAASGSGGSEAEELQKKIDAVTQRLAAHSSAPPGPRASAFGTGAGASTDATGPAANGGNPPGSHAAASGGGQSEAARAYAAQQAMRGTAVQSFRTHPSGSEALSALAPSLKAAEARRSSIPGSARRDSLPLGVTPLPPAPESAPPASGTTRAAAKAGAGAKTVLGLAAPPLGNLPQVLSQLAPPSEAESLGTTRREIGPGVPAAANFASTRIEGTPHGPLAFGSPRSAGTMLGMSAPLAPPASAGNSPSDRVGQGRTMLGVPVASLSPPAARSGAPAPYAPPHQPAGEGAGIDPDIPTDPSSITSVPPAKTVRNPLILAVIGVVLVVFAALLTLRVSKAPAPSDVTARIATSQAGESLVFEVPRAPEGSKLQFGGQEQPLVGGKASFPLAADSLRVGDNVVLANVVKPNGDSSPARITLSVFYRVWVDTAALRDRSALNVVVNALPGTQVELEGQALTLDKEGHGTRSFPLEVVRDAKGGQIDHVVHYKMRQPSGETVSDELHTKLPVAMMQVDRPGPTLVTDREAVEIAGAVGRETQVEIDGTEVPVREQRFSHKLALPKPGEYEPQLIARAPGKAPFGVMLKIERVASLADSAKGFEFDKGLSYAKLATNPASFKGQSIAIEGRVYAFDARAGSSVIQMLVRPCPGAQRCSLWVVDPQASEVGLDKWVRVLGVVDGEQQFRSEKNQIVTVPKVVARFILPAKP